jgi:hypothetical protein
MIGIDCYKWEPKRVGAQSGDFFSVSTSELEGLTAGDACYVCDRLKRLGLRVVDLKASSGILVEWVGDGHNPY